MQTVRASVTHDAHLARPRKLQLVTRAVHCSRPTPAPKRKAPREYGHAKQAASLLAELFPQELRKPSVPGLPRDLTRIIPRRPLDTDPYSYDKKSAQNDRSSPTSPLDEDAEAFQMERIASQTGFQKQALLTRHVAVLELRKASVHLSEIDFRRVQPSTKHIEGWTADSRGGFLKVIRGRDPNTLAPNGTYLLIFSSQASAKKYMAHITELHKFAQGHLRSSSALATLAGTNSPVKNYALISPALGISNSMRIIQQPFGGAVRSLVEHGGYKQLMHNAQSPYEVMLDIEGQSLSVFTLRRMFFKDGRARNASWETVGPHGGVRRLVLEPDGKWQEHSGVAELAEEDKNSRDQSHGWERRRAVVKDIVSFGDESSARRFVHAWHRRDVTRLLDEPPTGDTRPIVNAELIW